MDIHPIRYLKLLAIGTHSDREILGPSQRSHALGLHNSQAMSKNKHDLDSLDTIGFPVDRTWPLFLAGIRAH